MNALILSGSSHIALAKGISSILRIPLVEHTTVRFSNTEIKVNISYTIYEIKKKSIYINHEIILISIIQYFF